MKFFSLILLPITVLLACTTCAKQEGLCIYITGDVMLDRGIRKQINRQGFQKLFEGVKTPLKKADAVVINLECPLCATEKKVQKPFTFRGEPSWADSLKAAGVTHACLANNHTYDQGAEGLAETIRQLKRVGIVPIGAGRTKEERIHPAFIGCGANRLALYSISFLSTRRFSNKVGSEGICNTSATELGKHIAQLKLQEPHTKVVVLPHWGTEYCLYNTPLQKEQADTLTKAGADLIVGHHPHVVQNTDTLNGKTIFYSLGNFIFDQVEKEDKKVALLELKLEGGAISTLLIPLKIKHFTPFLTTE